MKFKDEREEEITEEDTEWKEILKHIRSSISGSKGNVFKVENNMNENEEDEFAMQRDLEKRRCRLYDGTFFISYFLSLIYPTIHIYTGTHRIMRRRTTSNNIQHNNSTVQEDESASEEEYVLYEVTIPHGLLIDEVWVEYGEVIKGIKEDKLSKKMLVEVNSEGRARRGWVDRTNLMVLPT